VRVVRAEHGRAAGGALGDSSGRASLCGFDGKAGCGGLMLVQAMRCGGGSEPPGTPARRAPRGASLRRRGGSDTRAWPHRHAESLWAGLKSALGAALWVCWVLKCRGGGSAGYGRRAAALPAQGAGAQGAGAQEGDSRASEPGRLLQTLGLRSRANIQKFTNAGCALHFTVLAKVSVTG